MDLEQYFAKKKEEENMKIFLYAIVLVCSKMYGIWKYCVTCGLNKYTCICT